MKIEFNKLVKKYVPKLRSLVVFSLIAMVIFLANPSQALAKRGGGRVGGTTFRSSPSRSLPRAVNRPMTRSNRSYPPTNTYNSYNYGGGYGGGFGGGLFFLPFLIGGGGGSLVGLLAVVAIAGVILQAVRNSGLDNLFNSDNGEKSNSITVSKIQIGLLSSARQLQQDLNRLAMEADTNTSSGLALLLREATVSLLRHPEYWVYANSVTENTNLELAEQKFNTLAMSERSKLNAEIVSNFNNRLLQNSLEVTTDKSLEAPSEYIVVTLITAMTGNSKLPQVRSAEELRTSLTTIGSISDQQLLAVEILWEPQSENYTLTADQVVGIYPTLIRI